jgi:hypothetical protein
MAGPAYAGHAGEMSGPFMMPHELMGWLVVLALLGVALLGVVILAIWRLARIERRLQALEQAPAGQSRGSTQADRPV